LVLSSVSHRARDPMLLASETLLAGCTGCDAWPPAVLSACGAAGAGRAAPRLSLARLAVLHDWVRCLAPMGAAHRCAGWLAAGRLLRGCMLSCADLCVSRSTEQLLRLSLTALPVRLYLYGAYTTRLHDSHLSRASGQHDTSVWEGGELAVCTAYWRGPCICLGHVPTYAPVATVTWHMLV
jgi:hypothetical protein